MWWSYLPSLTVLLETTLPVSVAPPLLAHWENNGGVGDRPADRDWTTSVPFLSNCKAVLIG